MTTRERFCAALDGEHLDHICHTEHGMWEETHARWLSEGLSPEIIWPDLWKCETAPRDAFTHFQIGRQGYIIPHNGFFPSLPTEMLAEDERTKTFRDGDGRVVQVSKVMATLPNVIDYPVKDVKTYRAIREKYLQPSPLRFREKWPELAEYMRHQQEFPVCTHMNGFFAVPRDMMGVQNTLIGFYDQPELMHEILRDHVDYCIAQYETAIRQTKVDFAFIWEDMCFKNGPLVSPLLFREFLMPAYKRLTGFLRDMGIRHVIVDSDGDVTKLIPLWLECGVTGLLPFEVQSGMDVVKLGEEYPQLFMVGGIDKFRIAAGKASIDRELDRVIPAMLKRGRYWAALDHWVPPEISLESFTYYCDRMDSYRG